jgi:peptidoglycan hydrolase-like protein with peptidoglycan-binding domain
MKILVPKLVMTPPPKPRIDLPAWPGYAYVAYGKKNGYVQKMQSKLRSIGYAKYLPSGSDGVYGNETKNAVLAYQKKHTFLTADGVVGPKTWESLDAAV